MDTLQAHVKLFCSPYCGYVSGEIPVTFFSDRTCHIKCRSCEREVLKIHYMFHQVSSGIIYLRQEQQYLNESQKEFCLLPGDTVTATFEDWVAHTKTIITLLF